MVTEEGDYIPTEQSFKPIGKKIRNKSTDNKSENKVLSTLPSKIYNDKKTPVYQKKKIEKPNNPNKSMIEPGHIPITERAISAIGKNNKIRNLSQENNNKAISKSPIIPIKQKVFIGANKNTVTKNIPARTSSATPGVPTPQKMGHLNQLIQKAKEKEEKINKIREIAELEKKEKELEGCTFKPKINNKFIPTNKAIINERQVNTYERHLNWNNKKTEK